MFADFHPSQDLVVPLSASTILTGRPFSAVNFVMADAVVMVIDSVHLKSVNRSVCSAPSWLHLAT